MITISIKEKKYLFIGWNEYDSIIKKLAKKIHLKYDCIMGIPRGGIIPAINLSHLLDVPIEWNYNDALKRISNTHGNILLVDDINDTGKTLISWHKDTRLCPINFDFAVLLQRSSSKFAADYVGKPLTLPDWIVFPWENKESSERKLEAKNDNW